MKQLIHQVGPKTKLVKLTTASGKAKRAAAAPADKSAGRR